MDLQEHIKNVLTSYKTVKGSNFQQRQELDPFIDTSDIFEYTHEDEIRRCPFTLTPEGERTLAYSHFMSDVDSNGCLTDTEYLYHPFNYKSTECPSKASCTKGYCPHFHNENEKEQTQKFIQGLKHIGLLQEIVHELNTLRSFTDSVSKDLDDELNSISQDAKNRKDDGVKAATLATLSEEDRDMFQLSRVQANRNYRGGYVKKDRNGRVVNRPNLVLNEKSSNKYYYKQEVEMFEDINHEFKNFTHLEVKTITNYICGFLNSYGGKLYFGINNDGLVKGIQLSRQDIDQFQIDLDISLRRFQPEIFPDQIVLKFHEVCSDSTKKYIYPNKYVVEIEIKPPLDSCDVYINSNWECYIKRSGSLNNLNVPEMIKFMKGKLTSKFQSDVQRKDKLEGRNLDGMGKGDLQKLKKDLMQSLQLVTDALNKP